jgi:hypothetical protein
VSEYSEQTMGFWSDFEEELHNFRQELIVPTGEPSPDAPQMGFRARAALDRLLTSIRNDLDEGWRG